MSDFEFHTRITRPVEAVRFEQFRMLLHQATEPDVCIDRLGRALRTAATRRAHELGGTSPTWSFAVEELLPYRIRNARQYLRREIVHHAAFESFIDFVGTSSCSGVATSATLDDVAEAVVAGVDDLHAYLRAHGLVGEGYDAVENRISAMLAEFDPESSGNGHEPTATAEHDTSQSAQKNELALAA